MDFNYINIHFKKGKLLIHWSMTVMNTSRVEYQLTNHNKKRNLNLKEVK